jgi:hypothetical protein
MEALTAELSLFSSTYANLGLAILISVSLGFVSIDSNLRVYSRMSIGK